MAVLARRRDRRGRPYRRRPAGARAGALAGALAAILGAPVHVTIGMTALLSLHRYALTDPYDIASYPRSGFPDVAGGGRHRRGGGLRVAPARHPGHRHEPGLIQRQQPTSVRLTACRPSSRSAGPRRRPDRSSTNRPSSGAHV